MQQVKRKTGQAIKSFNLTEEQRARWKQIQFEIKDAMSDELKQKLKEYNKLTFDILRNDFPNEKDVQHCEVLWNEIQVLRVSHNEAIKKIRLKYSLIH